MEDKKILIFRIVSLALSLSIVVCGAAHSKDNRAVEPVLPKLSEKSKYVESKPPYLVHPVLGISSLQPLNKAKFERADFKKLCHMDTGEVRAVFWDRAFARAEWCAAQALATKFRNSNKADVQANLGVPKIAGRIPDFLKNTGGAREQLTYFVGGGKEGLMFFFKDNSCVQSRALDWEEFFAVCQWAAGALVKDAVGKTYEQILKENGEPDSLSGITWDAPADMVHKNFHASYEFGDNSSASFDFRDGICTSSGVYTIIH